MDDRPPLPKEVVRAFLSLPETIRWVHAHVKASVPEHAWEQVAQDALLEAIESPWVPSDEAALKSWLRTITDRVIADFLEKRKKRSKFEGPPPAAPVRTDEAGLPIDDPYDDAIADIDASVDPRKPSLQTQGFIIRRFLAEVTAKDDADRQTFEIMCEHYDEEKSYEQIARERKIPVGTLNARVHRFENKYRERCEKYRSRVILLMWLGGGAVVAVVAIVAWVLLHRGPKIEPISPEPPSPAPSASYDRRLDIAEPPAPSAPVPPSPAPKQPVPRLKP